MLRCSGCSATYRLDDARVPTDGVRVRCPSCGHVFRLRRAPRSTAAAENTGVTPQPATRVSAVTQAPAPRPPQVPVAESDVLPGLERHSIGGAFSRPPAAPAAPKSAPEWRETSEPAAPRFRWEEPGTERDHTLALGSSQPAAPARRLETPPFRPGGPAAGGKPAPGWNTAVEAARQPVAAPSSDDAGAHDRARRLARVLVSDILVYNQPARDQALREGNLISALGNEVDKAWALYKAKVDRNVADSTTYFKDALNEILADGQKVF